MIQVRDLGKKYNDHWAVKDLSFHVKQGEIFGLLGPNGAGKTTTVRMLTGQLQPTSGSVSVARLDPFREQRRLASLINMVFEEQNLYPRLSGYENLHFFQRLYNAPAARIDAVLEMVGLSEVAQRPVRTYSNGMRQRLIVARALLNQPQVLFLDEPTKGLDPVAARHIRHILRKLSQQGATILLTTQYVEEADDLCQRVAFLRQGELVALDAPATLKRQYSTTQPQVEIVLAGKEGGPNQSVTFDLQQADDVRRLRELLGSEKLLTIHSREALLEDVYVQLIGEGLTL